MAPIQRISLPPHLPFSDYTKALSRQQQFLLHTISQLEQHHGASTQRIEILQMQVQKLQSMIDTIRKYFRKNSQYMDESQFLSLTQEQEPLDTKLQHLVLERKQRLEGKIQQYETLATRLKQKKRKYHEIVHQQHQTREKRMKQLQHDAELQKQRLQTLKHNLHQSAEEDTQKSTKSVTQEKQTNDRGQSPQLDTSSPSPKSLQNLKLPDMTELQQEWKARIDTAIEESNEIIDKMRKTIKTVEEQRTREESLLQSPQTEGKRSVKKMRLH